MLIAMIAADSGVSPKAGCGSPPSDCQSWATPSTASGRCGTARASHHAAGPVPDWLRQQRDRDSLGSPDWTLGHPIPRGDAAPGLIQRPPREPHVREQPPGSAEIRLAGQRDLVLASDAERRGQRRALRTRGTIDDRVALGRQRTPNGPRSSASAPRRARRGAAISVSDLSGVNPLRDVVSFLAGPADAADCAVPPGRYRMTLATIRSKPAHRSTRDGVRTLGQPFRRSSRTTI